MMQAILKQGRWPRDWKVLGLQPTPELLAVSVAYLVQGLKSQLASLAEQYYLKDLLLFSPAKAETWKVIAGLPWVVKPLYGFISDTIPILGMRRRPYLVACGLAGALSFALLGALPPTAGAALALMALGELAIAFSDVVIDGVVVERSRNESQATAGSLQSICWGSQAVGRLSSAYTSGWLIDKAGPRMALALMAIFPLAICLTAGLIREAPRITRPATPDEPAEAEAGTTRHGNEEGEGDALLAGASAGLRAAHGERERGGKGLVVHLVAQLRALGAALATPGIYLPALFLFAWTASPSAGGTMFYFYTNALKFSAEFIGRIALLDGFAQLIGVILYNKFLRKIQLRTLFFWLTLVGVAAGFTQLVLVTGLNRTLGLSDKLFVLVDSVLLTGLGRIMMMPSLVLAARICPEGVEATLYSALMSIANAAAGVGDLLGAGLTWALGITATRFDALPALVAICAVGGLLPLPLLRFVPHMSASQPAEIQL
ncbi:hypothetical protein WJX81_008063 [Elliptochloris bilobata]|uniref:Biopterin transport-related protein BT1 n=1 Tax=Elliptochloris bilobata TaxID=381761 RepID=A0AAW1QXV9_9CHLO